MDDGQTKSMGHDREDMCRSSYEEESGIAVKLLCLSFLVLQWPSMNLKGAGCPEIESWPRIDQDYQSPAEPKARLGWGFGQPDLMGDVPAHGRGWS